MAFSYDDLLKLDKENGLPFSEGTREYREEAIKSGEWTPEQEAVFQRRDKPKNYAEWHQTESARNIFARPEWTNAAVAEDIAKRIFAPRSDPMAVPANRPSLDSGAIEALLLYLLTAQGGR